MVNKRIRELAEKAGILTEVWHKDSLGNVYKVPNFEAEKFAELIVRECMGLTHWKDFDMSLEQRIRLSVYQDIKEHFGIKE